MQPFTLPSTVSARDIQRGYKKVFDTVKRVRRPVVVMANNDPQAAIISIDMLEEYNRLKQDEELFTIINEIWAKNRSKDPDEVLRDVTGDVEEVRQRIYEKTFGSR